MRKCIYIIVVEYGLVWIVKTQSSSWNMSFFLDLVSHLYMHSSVIKPTLDKKKKKARSLKQLFIFLTFRQVTILILCPIFSSVMIASWPCTCQVNVCRWAPDDLTVDHQGELLGATNLNRGSMWNRLTDWFSNSDVNVCKHRGFLNGVYRINLSIDYFFWRSFYFDHLNLLKIYMVTFS